MWCAELLEAIRDGAECKASERASAAKALIDYPGSEVLDHWIETRVTSLPRDAVNAMEDAGDLLRQLWLKDDLDPMLRRHAQYILRHYPGAGEIRRCSNRLQRLPIDHWLQHVDTGGSEANTSASATASMSDLARDSIGHSTRGHDRRLAMASFELHRAHADERLLAHVVQHASDWHTLRALSQSADMVAHVRHAASGSDEVAHALIEIVQLLERDH